MFGLDQCLWIEEEDGAPFNSFCGKIKVSNGSFTNNGDGTFSLTTSAGAGSGTVNSGVANRAAYYPATGTTVDDTSVLTFTGNSATITGSQTVTGSFRVGSSSIVPRYLVNIYDTTGVEADDTPSLYGRSDNNQFNVWVQEAYGDDIISPIYRMRHARNTLASPLALQSGDVLARWSAEGWTSAATWGEEVLMRFDMPGAITFFTTPGDSYGDANLTQRMVLDSFGNLAINDTTPDARLDVTGSLFIDGETNQVQATIQGNATQTADILVVENSAGVDILSVDTTGADIDGTLTVSGTVGIQNRKSLRFYEAVANGVNYDEFLPAASLAGNFVLTIPSETGTLCSTGSVCSGYQASGSYITALTGDVVASGPGSVAATIQANAVGLGTDSTGDFVGRIVAGNGMDSTGASTGEAIVHTLSLDLASVDPATSTTGSYSGLEFANGELNIIAGCSDGAPLEWNNTTGRWICGTDGGGVAVWTDADPMQMSTTTRDVAIGAALISSAKLSVDGDADQVQFAVQGHSTQSTNGTLVLIEKSDGTNIVTVTNTGSMIIGKGTSTCALSIKNASNVEIACVQQDGSIVVTGDGSQSTISEGLKVNNADGTDTDDDFDVNGTGTQDLKFKASTGSLGLGTATPTAILDVVGGVTVSGTMRFTGTSDIGEKQVDGADNTACNNICFRGCARGYQNATGVAVTGVVNCDDATADVCACFGGS